VRPVAENKQAILRSIVLGFVMKLKRQVGNLC
jgi:hypothetical protein